MISSIDQLIKFLGRLPGLGPRSGRRMALHLLKNKENLLRPLEHMLNEVAAQVVRCVQCGNLDTCSPCSICTNPERQCGTLCVVADVDDVWALERSGAFKGQYHILGGVLSAMEGVGPDKLNLHGLLDRLASNNIKEIVLALSATIEGQTTAHYVVGRLDDYPHLLITKLAHGVPVGGELDYLDDGTLMTALKARRPF